MHCAVQ